MSVVVEARFQGPSGTRISQKGQEVRAIVIAPVYIGERLLIPAGSMLIGEVKEVVKLGLGLRHTTARIEYRFLRVQQEDGESLPVQGRMLSVETAKESVDPKGRVLGIRATTNVGSMMSVNAWRLLLLDPAVGLPVWGVKFLFARSPDPEIEFPAGTEFRAVLDFKDPGNPGFNVAAIKPIGEEAFSAVRDILQGLSSQRIQKKSGEHSDLVNLVLLGSFDEVQRAFEAAGWSTAESRSPKSIFRTYRSIVERVGYHNAPVSSMRLAGLDTTAVFQKSLNTFSKRHHVRLWLLGTFGGQSVWVAAATEDTGYRFQWKAAKWTHESSLDIDDERAKVVNDLLFTSCVERAGLVGRADNVEGMEASRREGTITDGQVAVVQFNHCSNPRSMLVTQSGGRRKFGIKTVANAFWQDVIRSNFVPLAVNSTKLTTTAKTWMKEQALLPKRSMRVSRSSVDVTVAGGQP